MSEADFTGMDAGSYYATLEHHEQELDYQNYLREQKSQNSKAKEKGLKKAYDKEPILKELSSIKSSLSKCSCFLADSVKLVPQIEDTIKVLKTNYELDSRLGHCVVLLELALSSTEVKHHKVAKHSINLTTAIIEAMEQDCIFKYLNS